MRIETFPTVAPDGVRRGRTDGMEDAPLVVAARSGDRDAFGALVEIHWRQLLGLARSVLAGSPLAEDLVQDALLVAWQRLPDLRDPAAFGAWVRRIVARACLRQLRTAPARAELTDMTPEPRGGDPGAASERRLDIVRALRTLAPRQRAVLYLGAEGRTDREIGGILGIFAATVRVHRLRARRVLRRTLEDYR